MKQAILKRAVELLEQPDSHIQFYYWQLPAGDEHDGPLCNSAVSREMAMKAEAFCAEGAVLRACYEHFEDDAEALRVAIEIGHAFQMFYDGQGMVGFNDGGTADDLPEVRASLRRLAEEAYVEEAAT